jgi:myo-inositol 2-dehydrogenase/D-chiro-inositol 1-dehydrogenase/scyllo-inositol 2-dehydrogenase (NAD+)
MYDIEKSNGPLAEVCSHDIDTIRWLTGSEFKSVYALAGNYRSPEAKEKFPDFYDSVILLARMADGTISNVEGAQGVQYGYDARVEILGENGLITVGGLQESKTTLFSKEKSGSFDVVKSWMSLFEEAYMEEDKAFIDAVRTKKEPLVTGLDGLEAVKVVKAGNLSIVSGKIIELKS